MCVRVGIKKSIGCFDKAPKIIQTKFMLKKYCLNLFGTLWVRDKSWIDKYVINHERIHDAQQRELLWVPFYLFYVLEWIVRLIQYRNSEKAYHNISFEREAYTNGHDLTYLSKRPTMAFIKYLKMH